jgi:hypothetical protein
MHSKQRLIDILPTVNANVVGEGIAADCQVIREWLLHRSWDQYDRAGLETMPEGSYASPVSRIGSIKYALNLKDYWKNPSEHVAELMREAIYYIENEDG